MKLCAYASFTDQYLPPFDDQEHFQSIQLKSFEIVQTGWAEWDRKPRPVE